MENSNPPSAQLTAAEEEWLLRAATKPPRSVMPAAVVATLVAAGLGQRNTNGALDLNDAGRQYLTVRDLPTAEKRRPHTRVHSRRIS
jgi:hypothetical protein